MVDTIAQKERFISLCREKIHRDGIERLLEWLSRSDFFTAPASTHFHGAYEGGLCEHSIDVYECALKTVEGFGLEFNEESLLIAALFHDLCKVNFYKKEMRNRKIDGKWQEVPSYAVDEKYAFGGHGSKSVFLVQQFMQLKTEEASAINCHMGFSDVNPTATNEISRAYAAFPLAWVIHVADEAATYLIKRI